MLNEPKPVWLRDRMLNDILIESFWNLRLNQVRVTDG